MIKTFRHKGLEKFFYEGDKSGINAAHAARLGRILDRLDASIDPQDMDLPGLKFHELKGREKGLWAVWVSDNWRIIYIFKGNNAVFVDYRDYH